MNNRLKGIICIVISAFCFALMSAFVRLSGDLPSVEKAFFRNLIALIIVVVTIIVKKEKLHMKKSDGFVLFLRSLFGTIGLLCNFYAVDHLALADASMMQKLSPFFVIVLSAIILKEKCSPVQWMAVIGAFIGALFIIKPSGNFNNFPAVIAAIGGLGAGSAYTMVRILGKRKVTPDLIIMAFSGFSCLVCLPLMIISWKTMTLVQLLMLLLAGTAAAGGQFAITRAYIYAPAKQISVYDYSQIVFSAILGFIIFGQIPDGFSFLGYFIIIAMAVWMFIYNKRED